jgi:hypothetical protein
MEESTLTITGRRCKDCGALLGPGREDRQYCDSGCRTNYNNRKRREAQVSDESDLKLLSPPDYITRIQEILLNNRKILEGLCNEEKASRIKMRDLIGKGFNTKFMTSVSDQTESGKVYDFCFEYGYCEVDEYAIVICRKREVD